MGEHHCTEGTAPTTPNDPFAYPAEPHERRHGPLGISGAAGIIFAWLPDSNSASACVYRLRREARADLIQGLGSRSFPPQGQTPGFGPRLRQPCLRL
jgi:hypothetical protein